MEQTTITREVCVKRNLDRIYMEAQVCGLRTPQDVTYWLDDEVKADVFRSIQTFDETYIEIPLTIDYVVLNDGWVDIHTIRLFKGDEYVNLNDTIDVRNFWGELQEQLTREEEERRRERAQQAAEDAWDDRRCP